MLHIQQSKNGDQWFILKETRDGNKIIWVEYSETAIMDMKECIERMMPKCRANKKV